MAGRTSREATSASLKSPRFLGVLDKLYRRSGRMERRKKVLRLYVQCHGNPIQRVELYVHGPLGNPLYRGKRGVRVLRKFLVAIGHSLKALVLLIPQHTDRARNQGAQRAWRSFSFRSFCHAPKP
jgi:hypothetical protein